MDPYKIIFHPFVTEKTMNFMEKNNALEFVVKRDANKPQIKEAVEKLFNVEVLNVKTANLPGKPRRLGRSEGYKSGYKKASVTLKEGQKIEIVEGV